MPDVPADHECRTNGFGELIDPRICAVLAVVPQLFPGKNFRILDEQTPVGNEIAVSWT